MEDVFSYDLRDFLMFSPSTYFRMIELYVEEVTIVALLPSLLIVLGLLGREMYNRSWPLLALVGVLFCLVGWQFFWVRFQEIMWAAQYFAGAFILQGIMLFVMAYRAAVLNSDVPRAKSNRLLSYSPALILLYPLIGYMGTGTIEFVGITADPTAALAVAVLLLTKQSWWVFAIPVLWAIFSCLMMIAMDLPQAWLLPLLLLIIFGWFSLFNFRQAHSAEG